VPSKPYETPEERQARREQAIKQFEGHRNSAQYEAAMDRWKAGDPFTCEAQLRSIVGRDPQHLDSRRALADLAMERGDEAAAETQLREILKASPDDAPTHHSLGLLLQSTDRPEEAQKHLARAIELDPGNTLYRLSLPETP
jgi:predicted Zn-dependent protease